MQVGDEIFFFSEERLKAKGTEITSPKEKSDRNKLDAKLNHGEPAKRSPVPNNKKPVSPRESKERSLDCPSTKLSGPKSSSARLKTAEKAAKEGSKSLVKIQVENCYKESSLSKPDSPEEEAASKGIRSEFNCRGSLSDSDCAVINKSSVKSKKCNDKQQQQQQPASQSVANSNAKKPPSSEAGKNKFTWCGSCKSSKSPGSSLGQGSKTAASAAAAVAAAHERQTKSHLKRLSRSSLSTDSAAADGASSNNKITLNLSKYSPCASRLAASSKILSSDSLGCAPGASGGTSPESPLHVSRSKSPVQPSLSLKIQKPAATEQQTPSRSKSVSDSCVTSPTSDATSSSPPGTEVISLEDVSQNRTDERWSCNHRSPR